MAAQGFGKERVSTPPQDEAYYKLHHEQYVQCCYLHQPTMAERDVWILKALFSTPDGRQVSTLIPTKDCFQWHTIDDDTQTIFQSTNLDGYFGLPPWGADVKRAWQLLSSFRKDTGTCAVQDLKGVLIEFPLTNNLIRKALNLTQWSSIEAVEMRSLTDTERRATTLKPDSNDSTFDDLREPRIRRALEAFMLHFSFSYPHRFTKPKLFIAFLFTKALQDPASAKRDFAPYILKGIELTSRQKTKRGHSLSGILALTRVAYAGIGSLEELPPAEPLNGSIPCTPPKRRRDYAGKLEMTRRSDEHENDEDYALTSRNLRTKMILDFQQKKALLEPEAPVEIQEESPKGRALALPMEAASLDPSESVPNAGSTNKCRFLGQNVYENSEFVPFVMGFPVPLDQIFPQASPVAPVASNEDFTYYSMEAGFRRLLNTNSRQTCWARRTSLGSPSQISLSSLLCLSQSVNFSPLENLEDVPPSGQAKEKPSMEQKQLEGPSVVQQERMNPRELTVATAGKALLTQSRMPARFNERTQLQQQTPASQQQSSPKATCPEEWQNFALGMEGLRRRMEHFMQVKASLSNKDGMILKLTDQLAEATKGWTISAEDVRKYVAEIQELKDKIQAAELEKQESKQKWELKVRSLETELGTAHAEVERWRKAALRLKELHEFSQKRLEQARQEADIAADAWKCTVTEDLNLPSGEGRV